MTAIIEQTFRLKEDVVNPEPDRRARYDWTKLSVWKKGGRYRVVIEEDVICGKNVTRKKIESLSGLYHCINSFDNRFNLLMSAAVFDAGDPVAEMGRKAEEAGITQEMIIREVLDCGHFSIPSFESLLDRLISQKAEKEAVDGSGE